MIHVAVAEDNEQDRDTIVEYLQLYGKESDREFSVTVFTDGDDIIEKYKAQFQLLLLDIEMPLADGMTVAEKIRETDAEAIIVFITHNPQYAIRGYKVDALDYLVKPVDYYAFSQTMDRAVKRLTGGRKAYLRVRTKEGASKIDISKIRYIDVLDHYICCHTIEGNVTSKTPISEVEKELVNQPFYRCNRAFLVNLAYVDAVEGSELYVGTDRIPVSRARKKDLLDALNAYLSGEGI